VVFYLHIVEKGVNFQNTFTTFKDVDLFYTLLLIFGVMTCSLGSTVRCNSEFNLPTERTEVSKEFAFPSKSAYYLFAPKDTYEQFYAKHAEPLSLFDVSEEYGGVW